MFDFAVVICIKTLPDFFYHKISLNKTKKSDKIIQALQGLGVFCYYSAVKLPGLNEAVFTCVKLGDGI